MVRNVFSYNKLRDQMLFEIKFPKSRLTHNRHVVEPLHQTPQGQQSLELPYNISKQQIQIWYGGVRW